jgi:hypothetical protein
MNFEINKYLLNKMGWVDYSPTRGLYLNRVSKSKKAYNLFQDDPLVRFFIEFKDSNEFFIIKELTKEEKQKSKKLYKFINVNISDDKPVFNSIEFNSNIELLSLIIEHKACDEIYQRHIKINKLINNK